MKRCLSAMQPLCKDLLKLGRFLGLEDVEAGVAGEDDAEVAALHTSLPTTQDRQHLRNNFGGKHRMPSVIRMQTTEHAVLHRERSGDGGAEVDEGDFFV